jgi:DNA-binding PadR family transcriptional regulator
MSLLVELEEADFVYLRETANATAGNLSVQLDKLSEAGYISVEKTFEGKKPRTICRITPVGLNAFENYVDALKSYLK